MSAMRCEGRKDQREGVDMDACDVADVAVRVVSVDGVTVTAHVHVAVEVQLHVASREEGGRGESGRSIDVDEEVLRVWIETDGSMSDAAVLVEIGARV